MRVLTLIYCIFTKFQYPHEHDPHIYVYTKNPVIKLKTILVRIRDFGLYMTHAHTGFWYIYSMSVLVRVPAFIFRYLMNTLRYVTNSGTHEHVDIYDHLL
jgi:hypothetical protein